eukprot:CAMPEP_0173261576 /NCGR_PEP_ID=MMETSP1142-20121109/26267_1 /TAXON_ID=483371 /ORGANISM="non described non described, Strain CCMP2298" /LENGTH=280 /DNA_ID=CAMNT_0014196561 /DNA_START=113 /DNA_END=954 /DNA_ORIENTATION=-
MNHKWWLTAPSCCRGRMGLPGAGQVPEAAVEACGVQSTAGPHACAEGTARGAAGVAGAATSAAAEALQGLAVEEDAAQAEAVGAHDAVRIPRTEGQEQARAEVRRRSEGAPVFPMLGAGRGVHLGGAQFTLQILRCGHNYRLLGVDALRGCTYEGSVHAPEALGLIRAHNQAVAEAAAEAAAVAVRAGGSHPHAHSHSSHSSPIMPWQHERVVELLIGNLGLVPSLQPVTSLMGGNRQQYVLVARPGCIDAPPVQRSATALQLSGPSAQSLGAGVMHMAD